MSTFDISDLNEYAKYMRKSVGWDLKELAKAMGIPYPKLSRILNGWKKIDLEEVRVKIRNAVLEEQRRMKESRKWLK